MDLKHNLELYGEVGEDLKFLSTSVVRTKVLIGLKEDASSLGDLRRRLDLEAASISHALSQLVEHNYIVREDDLCFLSQTGKIICHSIIELMKTIYVVKQFDKLWLNHDMDHIPHALVRSIGDLENSELLESEPTDIFKPLDTYKQLLLKSKRIKGLSPIFIQDFLDITYKLIENDVEVEFIFTESILHKLLKHLDVEDTVKIRELLAVDALKIWKINEDVKVAFTVTEKFLFLGLFLSSGEYDSTKNLLSFDHNALKWGDNLFNYYKKRSMRIRI